MTTAATQWVMVKTGWLVFIGLLSALANCAPAPEAYKLNLPAPVASIYLRQVIPFSEEIRDSAIDATGHPDLTPSPNANDNFIARIVKSNVIVDLTRQGYRVTEDPAAQHDIDLDLFIFYQPDHWPFASRAIQIRAQISNADGVPLYDIHQIRTNPLGPLGDEFGFSADEMLADAAYEMTAQMMALFFHLQRS